MEGQKSREERDSACHTSSELKSSHFGQDGTGPVERSHQMVPMNRYFFLLPVRRCRCMSRLTPLPQTDRQAAYNLCLSLGTFRYFPYCTEFLSHRPILPSIHPSINTRPPSPGPVPQFIWLPGCYIPTNLALRGRSTGTSSNTALSHFCPLSSPPPCHCLPPGLVYSAAPPGSDLRIYHTTRRARTRP